MCGYKYVLVYSHLFAYLRTNLAQFIAHISSYETGAPKHSCDNAIEAAATASASFESGKVGSAIRAVLGRLYVNNAHRPI